MTNLKTVFICITALGAMGLSACAHKIQKDLDQKLAQEKVVDPLTLSASVDQKIMNAPGLTQEQRAKLATLKTRTRAKIEEMNEQSLKLRSVLYKELVSKDFNRREVDLIESKIKKTEKQKVNTLIGAVEEASSILGRETQERERQMDDFYFFLNRENL